MTDSTPIFTIHYLLTKFDLWQWRTSRSLTSPSKWLFTGLLAIVIALAFTLDNDYASRSLAFKFILFNVLAAAIFIGTNLVDPILILIDILLRPLPAVICEHVIHLTDRGLIETTEYNETLHKWNDVTKCTVTKHYVYIHLLNSGIHIIPRKFFPSDEALIRFREELEKRATPR